jgi:NAD-dependent deacetylase
LIDNPIISSQSLDKIINAQRIAVLTGAGISAASGVPTFRGKDGLWKNYKPEDLATCEAFLKNPQLVWEWYSWRRDLIKKVKPNAAHYALVELEKYFSEVSIITQNVDNLHILAGSRKVIELHGNIMRNKCSVCAQPYFGEFDSMLSIPRCSYCGALIRPEVVWFGEMLPENAIRAAREIILTCDILFVVGTSSVVEPAASLPFLAKSANGYIIEVNPENTPLSDHADECIRIPSAQFFPQLIESIGLTRGKNTENHFLSRS